MKPLLDDVETQKAMDQAAMLKQAPAGIHGISEMRHRKQHLLHLVWQIWVWR